MDWQNITPEEFFVIYSLVGCFFAFVALYFLD